MKKIVKYLMAGGGLALGGTLLWRHLVKHHHIPCPHWLSFLVDNPYISFVAGSRTLIERACVTPGMRVLDAGCGPGRLTVPLGKIVGPAGRVVAMDIQEEMLTQASEKACKAGLENIEYVHGGLGQGAIPQESFDIAFLVTVLGEIPDQRSALNEIFTSLEPGGLLSVTELIPDPHYQSRKTVQELAESTGFQLVESFGNWFAFTLNFEKPITDATSKEPNAS